MGNIGERRRSGTTVGDLLADVAGIALLCGQAHDTAGVQRALARLADAAGADAAMLLSWVPAEGRHRLVANIGYPSPVEIHLTATDTSPDLYGHVRAVGRPLYLSAPDAPIDFRETAHWGDHLEPAGFADGLTACLRLPADRYTGMLHLSATDRRFSEQTRRLVSALEHPLGQMVDRRSVRLPVPGSGGELPAVLVTRHGEVLELAEHPTLVLREDARLLDLVGRFLRLGADVARFLWVGRSDWYKVRLTRVDALPWCDVTALLVAERVDPPYGLTRRELDVLALVAVGLGNKAIASELSVSTRTVSTHVERILAKLRCGSRSGAAALVVREGLVALDMAGVVSRAVLRVVLADGSAAAPEAVYVK